MKKANKILGAFACSALLIIGTLLIYCDEAFTNDTEAEALNSASIQTTNQGRLRTSLDESTHTLYVRTNNETHYTKMRSGFLHFYTYWYDTEISNADFQSILSEYKDKNVISIGIYGVKVTDSVAGMFSSLSTLQNVFQCDGDLTDFYADVLVNKTYDNETAGKGLMIECDSLDEWWNGPNPSSLTTISGVTFQQPIRSAKNAFRNLTKIHALNLDKCIDCSQLENAEGMFENFALESGAIYDSPEAFVKLPTYTSGSLSTLVNTSNMFKNCKGFTTIGSSSASPFPIGKDNANGMFQGATVKNLTIGFSSEQLANTNALFDNLFFEKIDVIKEEGVYTLPSSIGLNSLSSVVKDLYINAKDLSFEFHPSSLAQTVSCFNDALKLFPHITEWMITSRV